MTCPQNRMARNKDGMLWPEHNGKMIQVTQLPLEMGAEGYMLEGYHESCLNQQVLHERGLGDSTGHVSTPHWQGTEIGI